MFFQRKSSSLISFLPFINLINMKRYLFSLFLILFYGILVSIEKGNIVNKSRESFCLMI